VADGVEIGFALRLDRQYATHARAAEVGAETGEAR
jgi:hypothetical protein